MLTVRTDAATERSETLRPENKLLRAEQVDIEDEKQIYTDEIERLQSLIVEIHSSSTEDTKWVQESHGRGLKR